MTADRQSSTIWIVSRTVLAFIFCAACRNGTTEVPPPATWQDLGEAAIYDVGGTILTRLVARDILGDTRLDLMTASRGDVSVRVLPGVVGGSFSAPVTLSIATDARDAAAADVNGDGITDLLATGHFDNAFFVRRGLGNGTFAAQTRYAVRNHGRLLAVGDLNGDAFSDVIAVHDGSGQPVYVTSYLGSASGALTQAGEIATPYFTAKGVATGDFDADGKTDLAIALADNRASALVFHGLGTGAFAAPLTVLSLSRDPNLSDGTASVAVGDLDGDGRDDLVLSRWDAANMLVVRLSMGSSFAAPTLIPLPSPVDVDLGDVNGDGKLDAIAANLEHGTLSLLLGQGTGAFAAPRTIAAGTSPAWVTVADFDQNGFADAAVIDQMNHKIRVLLSKVGP